MIIKFIQNFKQSRNWLRRKTVDKNLYRVTSYYPPEGVDSALAGFLTDDSPDSRDIISLIPYWEGKGMLTLEIVSKEEDKDKIESFILTKKGELPATAASYERIFFDGLFRRKDTCKFPDSIYDIAETLNDAKRALRKEAEHFYNQGKSSDRGFWGWVGIFISVDVGVLLAFLVNKHIGWYAFQVLAFLSLLFFIKKKNKKGDQAYQQLLGFKVYLEKAEQPSFEERIKENPKYMEEMMPYFVAFGLKPGFVKPFDLYNTSNQNQPFNDSTLLGHAFLNFLEQVKGKQ